MVVSEGPFTAGVSAELAARITEECFDFRHEPVIRIAGKDVPISVCPDLDSGRIPLPAPIGEYARRLVA